MSPAVAIYVKERTSNKVIVVHVCPTWYIGPETIGLKRKDRVKVRGVWAEIEEKEIFMASKIKMGNYFVLKVRFTTDGMPFWALGRDELARRKADVWDN